MICKIKSIQKPVRTILIGLVVVSFTLFKSCLKDPVVPGITTQDIGYYSSCTASCWGLTVTDGGKAITERGICLSTNAEDSFICNTATVVDRGDGLFLCILYPLIPNTTYYFKAYAKNAAGIGYGEIKSFTTNPVTLSTVTTLAAAISPAAAVVEGTITSECSSNTTESGVCWSTNPNPDITGNKIVGTSGSNPYSVNLTGLSANTNYYIRAYASNAAGTGYGNEVVIKTLAGNSIRDIEGNYYDQITIGTQVWMKENLRTTKYRDGSAINSITDPEKWFSGSTTPSYGENFIHSTDVFTYGRIYNSYAVLDSRKICPVGWHVPSDAEWTTLETYLGGSSIAGGKLKSSTDWGQNTNATNESGFSAVAGSYPVKNRGINGVILPAYYSTGFFSYLWSSDGLSGSVRSLYYYDAVFYKGVWFALANSVRCLKD
jgi:uncharacterized protein (TIGR02145 family)